MKEERDLNSSASSAALHHLFSFYPGVAAEDARLPSQLPPLHPEEAAQIATAVTGRQVEYAAVRQCARRAAARLGVPPFTLLNGGDRAPQWPDALVGSLTHTGAVPGGYAAAAVAHAAEMLTVGIDAEQARPLPLRLWRIVLTTDEQMRLTAMDLNPDRQGLFAKLIFSAKECFYKAQFPLTHRRLGFRDVEIDLDLAQQKFQPRLLAAGMAKGLDGHPGWRAALDGCSGRFLIDGELVRTALAIPR